MNLPPNFLDEIRGRVSLVSVIQRKLRLVKKGREWSGLCPFHNEKSPSFNVNEEKGVYLCRGCGEKGDIFSFVQKIENLDFMEAVEALAGMAGLEVPKPTPEARAKAERQATLHDAVAAACAFFEAQLQSHAGSAARSYLARRGLDQTAIERFHLGYAPSGSGLLRQQLVGDFPESLLLEAGLIGRRDGETSHFDYFRDRVMFPILDRRGKPVAFGGRVMGDAKPKYLNSPDTPIFHKGSMLYGMSWARQGVGGGAEVIVTEGYMDVIALHRAGFAGAVAPLGTALTEVQLDELWRLVPEPVLCFDGDAAGARAAARALERAMPLLQAGRSLRFAVLPDGEDPDTLVTKFGPGAMQGVLNAARPLAEFLWLLEFSRRPADTPERRADLGARLQAKAAMIADAVLRREYEGFFRNALYERLRPARPMRGRKGAILPPPPAPPPPLDPAAIRRRRQEALLAVVLLHPECLDQAIEDFAEIELQAPDLDRLRREILNVHTRVPGLDGQGLQHHLSSHGYAADVENLLSRPVLEHARFAVSGDHDHVVSGLRQLVGFLRDDLVAGQGQEAVRRLGEQNLDGVASYVDAAHEEVRQRRLAEAELDGSGPVRSAPR